MNPPTQMIKPSMYWVELHRKGKPSFYVQEKGESIIGAGFLATERQDTDHPVFTYYRAKDFYSGLTKGLSIFMQEFAESRVAINTCHQERSFFLRQPLSEQAVLPDNYRHDFFPFVEPGDELGSIVIVRR